jgi:hypothetical protein
MPQARKAHQLLNDSNRTNAPEASSTTPSHTDTVKHNPPATNSIAELSLCLVNLTESNRRTVWSYKIAGMAAP